MGTATCMIVFISKKIPNLLTTLAHFHNLISKETYLTLIGWNKSNTIVLVAKIENRITYISRPRINFFARVCELETVNVCQKAYSAFVQTIFNIRRSPGKFFGQNRHR